jgi:hypothetical protein
MMIIGDMVQVGDEVLGELNSIGEAGDDGSMINKRLLTSKKKYKRNV